ncbi:MAG: N-6 DNA methylase, partial [Acidobacteria bacterium]|nr:N-6 DNA methylase [Acidobacteriota bacterium]
MAIDPELKAHLEWLGYLQPVGLVVSPPALLAAQAHVNRNIAPQQAVLLELVREERLRVSEDGRREARLVIPDFPEFCFRFLGWDARDLAGAPGGPELADSLTVSLPEYGEALSPTYAVPDPDQPGSCLMLIQELRAGIDPDATPKQEDRHWHASPQMRFERLLRESKIPTGILCNGTHIRIVCAPAGESTGHLTFPVQAMCEVAGRPIVAALHVLLCAERLFTVPTNQRLPAILQQSRKYQNDVSVRLAEQVLAALHELLRGFQAAHEASGGTLLKEALEKDPSHIYGGLLASLLRMVFVLYAEDRGLMPTDSVYVNSYSVAELFERLREDAARYPDTMDQRYGAWSQLITLFRLIHDGAAHGAMRLPARHGKLFDPDAYPFLEGRAFESRRQDGVPVKTPRVSDGVIYRILENLLLLDGERLSYRALDVEQIGSVYEAMMGFELRVADGPSIAVRPENVVVNLQTLLAAEPEKRAKILKEEAAYEITGKAVEQLKSAKAIEELVAALGKKVSKFTRNVLPAGAMFLQPTDERRRSGSHYTPRSLTEPIVRTTFRPVFERLGLKPRPEQILDLKVCDPAMGSGAFLVEACRFLGDKLVEAWQLHGEMPTIPPDEDPQLYARRVVAQRCIYGVDKNPFAVDLAKLSLWLATLAKDHPFTFLDHALRCGDSLVGLSRQQIAQFHWDTSGTHKRLLGQEQLERKIEQVSTYRRQILAMTEDNEASILLKREKLDAADQALAPVRRAGDLLVAAFFNGSKDKEREALRKQYFDVFVSASRGNTAALERERLLAESLLQGTHPLQPFHWELEFPEIFERESPGFDAFVGNPPFAGRTTITTTNATGYLTWLHHVHTQSHGNSDLVLRPCERVVSITKLFARGFPIELPVDGDAGAV